MKKQVVVIHGGDTFDSYEEYLQFLEGFKLDFDRLKRKDWKSSLEERLGPGFEVIMPAMPCKQNAKYNEWKIWFEKIIPFLENGVVLVGHSLGGIFLAKYLSENNFPRKITATLLVAAPYDDKDSEYSLGDFGLPENLDGLGKQGGRIFIYHSEDDPVVPFVDFKKYTSRLPSAEKRIFKDREHFSQEEFPELVDDIRSLGSVQN